MYDNGLTDNICKISGKKIQPDNIKVKNIKNIIFTPDSINFSIKIPSNLELISKYIRNNDYNYEKPNEKPDKNSNEKPNEELNEKPNEELNEKLDKNSNEKLDKNSNEKPDKNEMKIPVTLLRSVSAPPGGLSW